MTINGRLLLIDLAINVIEETYKKLIKHGISFEFHISQLAFFGSALKIGTIKQSKNSHDLDKKLYERIQELENLKKSHKDYAQTKYTDLSIEKV